MTKGRSKWGFSVSERRALLFIISVFLVGWGYRLYQRSPTLDALPLTTQDSAAVESIRASYFDDPTESQELPKSDNQSNSSVQALSEATEASILIDINRASLTEFESLPGIGTVLAKRIIEERERRDGFNRVDEILEISGIGAKRFKKIRPLICCNPPN
jgi:competence ComEA-like helix-hairpin-helix protein